MSAVVVFLMVPPMFLFIMFTVMAYRRRNSPYEALLTEAGPIGEATP